MLIFKYKEVRLIDLKWNTNKTGKRKGAFAVEEGKKHHGIMVLPRNTMTIFPGRSCTEHQPQRENENDGGDSFCPRAQHQAARRDEVMNWSPHGDLTQSWNPLFWALLSKSAPVNWVTGLLNVFAQLCVSWWVWSPCQSTDASNRDTLLAHQPPRLHRKKTAYGH